jgi:long-chain acyl-CoA synthetase
VWPAEVEQVLYRHPAIQELAIFGVTDPLKGEAVRAAVILKAGETATDAEIIYFCRERMAAYKAPESVVFVDQLPKSATGKVLKRVLREQQAWPG